MPDRPKLSDLEILKNLEDEIGMKFRKLRRNSFTTHCYVLDKRLDVVGMSIPHFDGKKLPVNLLKLKKIRRLYLNNLKMNVFPIELRELPNLEYVEFWNSKISHLPPEALEIGLPIKLRVQATRGILLEGAKLTTPPIEIVAQGNLAIEQYYKSIEQEGEQANLNELKVVLVGDGGAGKTSLVRQIFGDEFNKFESQTHGIEVRKYSFQSRFRPIKVNFWDFGGQEIMHATHQFFLSHRSLYILVLGGRRDEKTEYWLKNIESFGGNSPILIVMNKIDQNPSFELNQRFLKEKYIGIKGFYRISCASKDGVETFIQKLKSAIVNVDLLRMTWPKSWFDVKNELEHLNQEYISYDAFRKICVDRKINESARQEVLLEFLHDLGVVLHFKDFELLDTQVLDPQWVTSGVYSIINSHVLAKRHGVLRISELSNILPMSSGQGTKFFYPPEKHRYIIDLMLKFELCFEINTTEVLIPDLLNVQEPKFSFEYANALAFVVDYDFLPKSIIPRFIVRMHKDIKKRLRWRTGVVLEDQAFRCSAVIRADENEKRIYIWVEGQLRRDYFAVIRHTLHQINSSFEKLSAIEKVPMPSEPEVCVSYDHLTLLEQRGLDAYIPDGSTHSYSVKKLLGSIYSINRGEEEMLTILRKLQNASDDEESLLTKANQIVQLQPNFFGLGVNLNALIKKLFK